MATALPLNSVAQPCDLWVLPPPSQSKWFSRVDWYLNWQLCKGLAHERKRPSVELFRVLEESGLAFREIRAAGEAPLMVISEGRIPASKCVVFAESVSLPRWLEAVHQMMSGLVAPRARVFLPSGASREEARAIWQHLKPLHNVVEFSTDEEEA